MNNTMTLLSAMKTSFVVALLFASCITSCDSFSPKGSAAVPLDKKKVAIVGAGGYLGSITFGFLQRASSLYETGLAKQFRCIGATSQTAVALNSILGKHFILAQADESFIKLTNMESIESIQQRLQGVDAIILGNEMVTEKRPITAGTFEKTPNDKTWEIYWDYRRGKQEVTDPDTIPVVETIIDNTLQACKLAGVQHVMVVGKSKEKIISRLQDINIPYTYIRYSNELINCPDYTFKKGVQGNLNVIVERVEEDSSPSSASDNSFMFREDLAAFCIQCLQSLSWDKSRCIYVNCDGSKAIVSKPSGKRPDQEWCVNSHVLAEKLANI